MLPSDVKTTYMWLEPAVVVVGGVELPVCSRNNVAPVEVDQCVVASYMRT